MPKIKCQIKSKAQIFQTLKISFLNFNIPLTFACLRKAASAKAGILKFGFIVLV